jgi:hypothetical protein
MHAEFVVYGDFAIALHAGDHIRRRGLHSIVLFIVHYDYLSLLLLTPALVVDVLLLLFPVSRCGSDCGFSL